MNKTLQKHVYVNIYIYSLPYTYKIDFFVITPQKQQQHRWSKVSCIIQRESLIQDDHRKNISPFVPPKTNINQSSTIIS